MVYFLDFELIVNKMIRKKNHLILKTPEAPEAPEARDYQDILVALEDSDIRFDLKNGTFNNKQYNKKNYDLFGYDCTK